MINNYKLFLQIDLINYTIISYTNTVALFYSMKFTMLQWERVISKGFNYLKNLRDILPINAF